MPDRQPIPAKLRFEVFKRDKFTCQYCGATAVQKLLHCDHIEPVAVGGETTLLNLITACVDCNLGKGARLLSDDSALSKQHRQLADMEERRQQLEMMRQWRAELTQHNIDQIDVVKDAFAGRSRFVPNDHGNISVRRWLRRYGLMEVLAAIDEAFDLYFTADTEDAWSAAFKRIPRMLSIRQQEKTDPHIRKLLYIQAILRNRLESAHDNFVEKLREGLTNGFSIDVLEVAAKGANTWEQFVEAARAGLARQRAAEDEIDEEFDEEEAPRGPVDFQARLSQARQQRAIYIDGAPYSPNAREILMALSNEAMSAGGYPMDMEWQPQELSILRGFQATGLIVPAADIDANDIVWYSAKNNSWKSSFDLNLPDPKDPAAHFNRFGGVRLSSFTQGQFSAIEHIYG